MEVRTWHFPAQPACPPVAQPSCSHCRRCHRSSLSELVCWGSSPALPALTPASLWLQPWSPPCVSSGGLHCPLTLTVTSVHPARAFSELVFICFPEVSLVSPACISDLTLSSLPPQRSLIVPLSPACGGLVTDPSLLCACSCDRHTGSCSHRQEPHGLVAGVKSSSRGCSESYTRAKPGVPWGDNAEDAKDFCVDEATGSGCLERRGSQQSRAPAGAQQSQAHAQVSSTPRELSGHHSLSTAHRAASCGCRRVGSPVRIWYPLRV